jgi:tetratricopeptide (TPR) repeat protein
MKNLRIVGALLSGALLLGATYFGVRAVRSRAAEDRVARAPKESGAAPPGGAQTASPADGRIRAGEGQVKQRPQSADGYNLLAAAYMQKARETGDFGFNAKAEAALAESSRVAPDNYDAIKLRAKLLLTYHRFREALAEARRAQGLRPEDHDVYGALTDACVELGDYDCAVESAQTMVDLRPDAASYARVSYLRSLHGDREGAIEAMLVAVKAADPRDPESVAWFRTHLGDELLNAGRPAEAEREYERALAVLPDYHVALAALARARIAAGELEAAAALFERAQTRVPAPDTAAALGDVYAKLGRAGDSRRQYELVEFIERTAGAASDNDSRQLALFRADHDTKLDEALEAARRGRESRADIFTEDALAWCLYKKGRHAEARESIERALRLGTRDPRMLYHAGMIYAAAGDARKAGEYLRLALEINPGFDVLQSDAARQALATLAARGRRSEG